MVPESDFASLRGLKAVVTGSSSGIGLAIAREFAKGGAHVLVHCHQSLEAAEALCDELNRDYGPVAAVTLADLGKKHEAEQFAEQAWKQSGGVDIWVNNAGVDLLTGPKAELDYSEKLEQLFAVDIRATMLLSRWIGSQMKTRGSGVILNIGWDQADRGMEGDSGELFAAAKNAVMGGTRSLAVSLAPEVRVNCIAPGWIQTAWGAEASDVWQKRVMRETPLKRWGTPADIAALARFLVSPEASYITGQVISANGGAVR